MDKVVKGATKIKLAAPKSKYIEAILSATHGGDAGIAEVFRTLQLRLRDSTWTIVFKSLIVAHLMIREGQPELTLKYIAESPKRLAISNFTDVQTQGTNIRRYSDYLLERARGFRDTKVDFVRSGAGRLKKLTVDKGLLRETEAVQNQIRTLVRCDMLGDHDPENEITLTAFRLLTMDLLELFKVMNEGTINVLERYFEMSRPDAERALKIYKTFGRQTDQVVQYLSVARQYEMSTRLEVPKLKHAPTTLTSSLEEYLNDPDFEVNRRQYLAQQQAKRGGKPVTSSGTSSMPFEKRSKPDASFPSATVTEAAAPSSTQPKGPAPDLIDFFESIEQNQQPMAQQNVPAQQYANGFPQAQQYQQTNFAEQQTGYNPFLQNQGAHAFPQLQTQSQQHLQPLQPDFTGAGFGGYTPQPQQTQQTYSYNFQSPLSSTPQDSIAQLQQSQPQSGYQTQSQPVQPQQTSSNPFRQSAMQTSTIVSLSSRSPRQSTNPFARSQNVQQSAQSQQQPPQPNTFSFDDRTANTFSASLPFAAPPPAAPQHPQTQEFEQSSSLFSLSSPQQQAPSQLLPQRTGTNPFARNRSPPNASQPFTSNGAPVVVNPTGGTNPFRQSAFVNQQTGQGWQHGNQGTFSGFDVNNVDTVPVFPRPGA